jgi:hypothetical protein
VDQHSKVGDAYSQNLTNLAGFQALDFLQNEGLTLIHRQAIHATTNQLADLLGKHQLFQISGRASPVAFAVESGLEASSMGSMRSSIAAASWHP